MAADEALPCGVHRLGVERLRKVPGVVAVEDRRRAAVVDLVAVAFADRRRSVAWKFSRASSTATTAMSSGSTRVEAAVEVGVREARLGGDTDDLAQRVDAGVGAAGGGDAERLLRDLCQVASNAPCTVGLSG